MTQDCSCDDVHEPRSLTVEQALEHIQAQITPLRAHERVALREALDRVLAQSVIAPLDIPPHVNSAMDGYALNSADLPGTGEQTLKVRGESFAGHPFKDEVRRGECVRIMTGAVLPEGTDTVIMQERVKREGDAIVIGEGHHNGENVRQPGEDMRAGQQILQPGRRINAADIGLLASLGLAEVDVLRRPRVAFFSTGDELKGVGQTLGEGDIYDSNRYTLYAMLKRLDVQIIDMGVVGDERGAIEAAFDEAARSADMVITSGGVSVGEADYVKLTLEKLGQVNFWKIAMKPGRPLAFGKLGDAFFFGLPGNPVSVMATFTLFARTALKLMAGEAYTVPLRLRAHCANALRKRPGRADFQRGIYTQDADGRLKVQTTGLQGSHVLSSMSQANCFIALPRESGDVEVGTEVEIIPFAGIL